MDDGELIERVSQFKILFDKKDPNFKNKVKKENAWISNGVIPIECEQRWTVLRNKYATSKRTSNSPSGSQSYTISWPYYSLMKFSDPFMQRRRTTTNFSISQSVSQSSSCYSGVKNIINTDSEVEKEGNDVLFDNQDNHYDLDQSMEEQENSMDETQALYENFINKKHLAEAPPVKKPKPLETNTQRLQESQLLNTNKNLAEIRRIRKLTKSKSGKDTRDGIVNKLGGCLNSFEKLIEKKQTNEDEDFVRSLSRDLSVFTPIEKIYLKKQIYECLERKLRENEL